MNYRRLVKTYICNLVCLLKDIINTGVRPYCISSVCLEQVLFTIRQRGKELKTCKLFHIINRHKVLVMRVRLPVMARLYGMGINKSHYFWYWEVTETQFLLASGEVKIVVKGKLIIEKELYLLVES